MSTSRQFPMAVDLDVFKGGTTVDPVDRDDVERALYALTGWAKPQRLVDEALDVIDSYATGVRAGRVTVTRGGHALPARCEREHLDDHVCPVVQHAGSPPSTLDEVATSFLSAVAELGAEDEPEDEPVAPTPRVVVRYGPTMTPAELLAVPADALDQLTGPQLNARNILLVGEQQCSYCHQSKPLDDFYNEKARLVGKASRCKRCANLASAMRKRR